MLGPPRLLLPLQGGFTAAADPTWPSLAEDTASLTPAVSLAWLFDPRKLGSGTKDEWRFPDLLPWGSGDNGRLKWPRRDPAALTLASGPWRIIWRPCGTAGFTDSEQRASGLETWRLRNFIASLPVCLSACHDADSHCVDQLGLELTDTLPG